MYGIIDLNFVGLEKFSYFQDRNYNFVTNVSYIMGFDAQSSKIMKIKCHKYRITGYIRSRNFRTDTGKLNFKSFIFVYVPYSNNVLHSNN